MKQSLTAIEQVKSEDIFPATIRIIIHKLEALIHSDSASLPEEGVKLERELRKILDELIDSEESLINLSSAAKKVYKERLLKISELSNELLTKYRDFLDEKRCQVLKEIYLFSFCGNQLVEGLDFLYKSKTNNDNLYIKNVAKGINLISKGLRNYPNFINFQNYEMFKELAKELLESIEHKQLNQEKLPTAYNNNVELIYLSCICILRLVEQFENTLVNVQKYQTKHKKISWEEEEEFLNSLIDIGKNSENTDYSPEEEEAFERVLKRLSD